MFFRPKYKYFLSVIAIFKNESVAIKEWVTHYQNQGVEHFYLINNGSTDNSVNEIREFVDQGKTTLVNDDKRWSQMEHYNNYFLPLKDESKWLIICDLDEFIYARNGFKTIADYLLTRSRKTGMVRIPWKMFGSSGFEKQPSGIVKNFTKRSFYDGRTVKPGCEFAGWSLNKAIVKSKCLKSIEVHYARIQEKYMEEDANGKPVNDQTDCNHLPISEELLNQAYLHLNHYAIQSKEWFLEVKCTRGDADGEVNEGKRNLSYFEKYDSGSNELIDNELMDINAAIQ